MSEISVKEMTQYLHTVAELEAAVYRQEKAQRNANWDLQMEYREPEKKKVTEPVIVPIWHIDSPNKPVESKNVFSLVLMTGFTIMGLFSFLYAVFFAFSNDTFPVEMLVLGICFLGMAFWFYKGYKKSKKDFKNALEEYTVAKQEYDTKVQQTKDNNQREEERYNEEKQKAEQTYNEELARAKENYSIVEKEIQKLDAPLAQTKATLQQLYDIDWIFPKYRNLVAMCTMYEYFASGRCTELTGASGAYNLYESELRQNIIIDKLDTVIKQLNNIAKNQCMLYSELQETNKIVQGISKDVHGIFEGTKRIEEYSHIAAVCSYATAKNTEALKYISLING